MRLALPAGKASSLSIPAMAGSTLKSFGSNRSDERCFRINLSATGPPMTDPAINPNVAAAIEIVAAPCNPMLSNTALNPPAVPCPPAIEIDPAAIPIRGFVSNSLQMPIGIKFCVAMMPTNRISIMTKVLPPCLMTLRLDWKPTEVKNANINTSFKVPSNVTSTCINL